MFNNLRAFSNRTGTNEEASDAIAALDPFLDSGETVRFVLTSSKGIERTADGRTTTIEPGSGHEAYAVVTDFRILFLVGSDAANPSVDVEFDLPSVTRVEARSGLLSTSLVVVAEESTTVKFKPSGGPDLTDVADYVDRIGSAWQDLNRALARTRQATEVFEERLATGDDAQEALTTARSRLSNAYHQATRHEDGPVDEMLARIEPVEADLDERQVEARLDRVDELVEATEDEDGFAATVSSLAEAADRLAEARDALADAEVDDDAVADTLDERRAALDDVAASLLDDAEAACHDALDADDPNTALERWETAADRYRTLLDAEWDGLGGASADALRYQLSWIIGRRIDALSALAASLEAEGDELDDAGEEGSTDRYERAKARAESARDLAAEHPHADADRFDDRLDELDEKIEVSEWQWGNA